MSVFVLKIIACVSMFIDHFKFAVVSENIITTYFGRFAFPIYAFLISEGYVHTRCFARYLGRLVLFSAISQIPAQLLFGPFLTSYYLNIFFTLTLGLIAIRFYDKLKNKGIAILCIIGLAYISEIIHADYGAIGVLIISCFYIFRDKRIIMTLVISFILFLEYAMQIESITLQNLLQIKILLIKACFALSSLGIIAFYNGKLGKSNKFIKIGFYLFYPVHLLGLWLYRTIFIW